MVRTPMSLERLGNGGTSDDRTRELLSPSLLWANCHGSVENIPGCAFHTGCSTELRIEKDPGGFVLFEKVVGEAVLRRIRHVSEMLHGLRHDNCRIARVQRLCKSFRFHREHLYVNAHVIQTGGGSSLDFEVILCVDRRETPGVWDVRSRSLPKRIARRAERLSTEVSRNSNLSELIKIEDSASSTSLAEIAAEVCRIEANRRCRSGRKTDGPFMITFSSGFASAS